MSSKIFSFILILLLLLSVTVPTACAELPEGWEEIELKAAVAAAPEVYKIVVAGATFLVGSEGVAEIGKNLGITWDGIAENFGNFLSDVQNELNKVFAKQWVKTANHRGQEAMNAVYDYYTALGSPKGKDDKWYFEARRVHDKVEVNMKQLTEEQAVKKMGEGKDIMTLDKDLAEKVVKRFLSGGNGRYSDLATEQAHGETAGYYDHIHFRRHANERLHCWIWRNT